MSKADELLEKVGLSLGIGMTLGESKRTDDDDAVAGAAVSAAGKAAEMMDKAGVSLGPIGMTLGESKPSGAGEPSSGDDAAASAADRPSSIASMTTAEWRAKYVNADGTVDLFLKDEYNAASRLAGCVDPATLPDGVDPAALANIENIAWSGLHRRGLGRPARGEGDGSRDGGRRRALDVKRESVRCCSRRSRLYGLGSSPTRAAWGAARSARCEGHQGDARAARGVGAEQEVLDGWRANAVRVHRAKRRGVRDAGLGGGGVPMQCAGSSSSSSRRIRTGGGREGRRALEIADMDE